MKHFYADIQGWFGWGPYYDEAIENAPSVGAHFVEVGAWKGRSTAYMAVQLANSGKQIQFDVVDTWQGSEEHQADPSVLNQSLYAEFLANLSPVIHLINPIRMLSVEAARRYQDHSLDFVFLDAAHDYDNVRADILAWLPKVKPGGVLAGDDAEWAGVNRAVNELLPGNMRTAAGGGFPHWRYVVAPAIQPQRLAPPTTVALGAARALLRHRARGAD